MTDRAQLVADLVRVLVEEGPCSASRLAPRVRARKGDVLRELRARPIFECVGGGRYQRWQLRGTGREPLHGDDTVRLILDYLHAIEARLDAVERRNGGEVRIHPPPRFDGDAR